MGYRGYPLWLTQDWDPCNYTYATPHTRLSRSRTSAPHDLKRWRKHYSNVLQSKLREGADLGDIDDRECTHSPIMQAIEFAMVRKARRPGIVDKLLQNASLGHAPFEVVSLTGLGTGTLRKNEF
jgi:hypothetical protein